MFDNSFDNSIETRTGPVPPNNQQFPHSSQNRFGIQVSSTRPDSANLEHPRGSTETTKGTAFTYALVTFGLLFAAAYAATKIAIINMKVDPNTNSPIADTIANEKRKANTMLLGLIIGLGTSLLGAGVTFCYNIQACPFNSEKPKPVKHKIFTC